MFLASRETTDVRAPEMLSSKGNRKGAHDRDKKGNTEFRLLNASSLLSYCIISK